MFPCATSQWLQHDLRSSAQTSLCGWFEPSWSIQEEGPLPLRTTTEETQKQKWQDELDHLQTEDDVYALPDNPTLAAASLFEAWTSTTQQWFDDFQKHQFDPLRISLLPDLWVDSFVDFTEVDISLQDTFLTWGHEALPGILAQWEDGEAEPLVEVAFYKLTIEFPRFQRTTRMSELRKLLATPADIPPEAPLPHRPARTRGPVGGPSTKTHYPGVKWAYGDQKTWHDY